jgi:hypothetical protein
MNRESLLKRLVDRKMASGAKNKALCVCLARKPAGGRRAASTGRKQ